VVLHPAEQVAVQEREGTAVPLLVLRRICHKWSLSGQVLLFRIPSCQIVCHDYDRTCAQTVVNVYQADQHPTMPMAAIAFVPKSAMSASSTAGRVLESNEPNMLGRDMDQITFLGHHESFGLVHS